MYFFALFMLIYALFELRQRYIITTTIRARIRYVLRLFDRKINAINDCFSRVFLRFFVVACGEFFGGFRSHICRDLGVNIHRR